VGVAVNEAGHHNLSGRFDDLRALRVRKVLQPPRRTDLGDHSVANQNSAVLNRVQFVQQRPTTGTFRAAQGQQLPRTSY